MPRLCRLAAAALTLALAATPQDAAPAEAQAKEEAAVLNHLMAEAGSSSIDLIHAFETFLRRYPKSSQRDAVENALLKASVEVGDRNRIILYGERALARSEHDVRALDQVIPALLARTKPGDSEKALVYAKTLEHVADDTPKPSSPGRLVQWRTETEKLRAKARTWQAAAAGQSGRIDEAIRLADAACRSYAQTGCFEEKGKWLANAGQTAEALDAYALAFAMASREGDSGALARLRQILSRLYQNNHPDEAGLGDKLLAAFDQAAQIEKQWNAQLRQLDPNALHDSASEFVLSALEGEPLALSSLLGKVVVLDFWATWCGPCRTQHPLFNQAREKFRENERVAILSVNTDSDRSLVGPFLRDAGWDDHVYFEDGLARFFRVTSIPTTLVLDTEGRLYSRITGFVEGQFAKQLEDRIQGALAEAEP